MAEHLAVGAEFPDSSSLSAGFRMPGFVQIRIRIHGLRWTILRVVKVKLVANIAEESEKKSKIDLFERFKHHQNKRISSCPIFLGEN